MKTFLTICICAMVSAGIYGFADMAVDVKNGTMIQYDHGDGTQDKSVTAAMLKKGMVNTQNSISKNAADFDLGKKVLESKAAIAKVPVTAFFTDFTESYSRGSPGGREEMVYTTLVPEMELPTVADSTTRVGTLASAFGSSVSDDVTIGKKPAVVTRKPISEVVKPNDEVEVDENPAGEIIPTTAIQIDSVPQVEEKPEPTFDYREFSRGAPRKKKPK